MNDLVKAIRKLADRKTAGSVCVGDLLRLRVPTPGTCPGRATVPQGELAEAFKYLREKLLAGLEKDEDGNERDEVAYQGIQFLCNRLEAGVAYGYIDETYLNGIK